MTIQEQIVAARVAQAAIKDYTQEQIDKLVYEVAKIIYKNAEPLAREAVDETPRAPQKRASKTAEEIANQ